MARPRKQIELGKEYGWLTVLSEASKDGHQNAVPPASAELKNRIQNKMPTLYGSFADRSDALHHV